MVIGPLMASGLTPLCARTRNTKVCGVVGVPDSTPVVEFRTSP